MLLSPLMLLSDDVLESVLSHLPSQCLLSVSAASHKLNGLGNADLMWQARVEELLVHDPTLSKHLEDLPGLPQMSARRKFFVARAAAEAKSAPVYVSAEERVADFKERMFVELRRLGDVEEEGTAAAKFTPFNGSIELPIPRQAVLELGMLLDDVPDGKLGANVPTYIAETVCGGQISHQTVRTALQSVKHVRGNILASRLHLVVPLLVAPFPRQRIAKVIPPPPPPVEPTMRELSLLEKLSLVEKENEELRGLLHAAGAALRAETARADMLQLQLWSDARELRRVHTALLETISVGESSGEQVAVLTKKLAIAHKAANAAQVQRAKHKLALAASCAARSRDQSEIVQREERTRERAAATLASVRASAMRNLDAAQRATSQATASTLAASTSARQVEEAVATRTEAQLRHTAQVMELTKARDEAVADAAVARRSAQVSKGKQVLAAEALAAAEVLQQRSAAVAYNAVVANMKSDAKAGISNKAVSVVVGNFLSAQKVGVPFHCGTGSQGPGHRGVKQTHARIGCTHVSVQQLRTRSRVMPAAQATPPSPYPPPPLPVEAEA
jgi:hypothetical protein